MNNLFLRPKAVAEKLGISTTTIWRWVKDTSRHFPQPIKLTPTITVFNGLEIEAWTKNQFHSNKTGVKND